MDLDIDPSLVYDSHDLPVSVPQLPLTGNINDFTENVLSRKHTIRNYERKERDGVIIITFDVVTRRDAAFSGFYASCLVHVGFAAAATAFPPAAGPLLAAGLASNVVGPAVGAAIGDTHARSRYFDSKTGELLGSSQNQASDKLNEIGCRLFQEGDYAGAERYHENACQLCLSEYENQQTFINNRDRARAEMQALKLSAEGDNLCHQGNHAEALKKYQEAYNISRVNNRRNTYEDQIDMASELLQLDILWKQAWQAENDSEKDRSNEAKETFQSILSKSQVASERFPNNVKFKQFETLVSLKMEGNNLFNQGIDFQRSGVQLLEEAQSLEDQHMYDLADRKLKEARDAFCIAKEKFLEGRKTDQRFVVCVEIVQDHINQAMLSIRAVQEVQNSSGFNNSSKDINCSTRVFSMLSESDACARNNNIYAQI